jgi:hypothetical protein
MREIIEIPADEVMPDKDDVLEMQGIPSGRALSEDVKIILQRATNLFLELSKPRAVMSDLSILDFKAVYEGEGLNEKETPVGRILGKSDSLALFSVTAGERITEKIDELFKINDFALGSMLDSVASVGTDRAADRVEVRYLDLLSRRGKITPAKGILRFSPGYCGWHMSGQRKLFEFLKPEDIGITLLDSFLMKPLKSISGVMVLGEKRIFMFEDSYPFCSQCRDHSCRSRIRTLLGESKTSYEKGIK